MTARSTTGAVTSVRARRTTTLLAAGLLPLILTACGVGLDPQTYRERTTQDATNAQAGDLALRDVGIQPPPAGQSELAMGADAQLTLAIVNPTGDKDTLTGVKSPAASSTKLVDSSGHDVTSIDVPADGSVEPGAFGVVLIGLTKALRPADYVDVTFSFATNGNIKLSVPVKIYDHPVPRASYEPKPAQE
jgi:copper(I)-binding protein